jgi:hypothetical protein
MLAPETDVRALAAPFILQHKKSGSMCPIRFQPRRVRKFGPFTAMELSWYEFSAQDEPVLVDPA